MVPAKPATPPVRCTMPLPPPGAGVVFVRRLGGRYSGLVTFCGCRGFLSIVFSGFFGGLLVGFSLVFGACYLFLGGQRCWERLFFLKSGSCSNLVVRGMVRCLGFSWFGSDCHRSWQNTGLPRTYSMGFLT